ncbi:hypothetical protein QBC35DRAFT_501606 [Podospora australis]|uniref:Kinesin motor domain-containing protein n=1 Tax=Podospora australis TaxID=1536484 RepID=A0AAN6WRV6_9PEZI|nr:hypothetical protein QBC35DRAFT_501606 [Podospora australis]
MSMFGTNEQFLIANAERYKKLVGIFKPTPPAKKTSDAPPSADMIVSTRIRPILEEELSQGFPECVYPRTDSNTIDLHELKRPVRGLPTLNSSNFTLDRVFGPEFTTSQVYESLVEPLVPWAWGGGVATLFAYGQTGSGKTYTVSGLEKHVAEALTDGSLEGERKIYVSIIELAGQTAFDLLNSRKQISVLEDSFGTTQLAGAFEHQITTKPAFLDYIEAAAALRSTASTLKNDTSSRSHAICRIRIENPSLPDSDDGLLYLVDLAGSEAARDKTEHDTTRMKEAREINSSLSVLKDCIRGRALADLGVQGGKIASSYVPFRQSTLTKTLKHVFDPASSRSCKTVVVACVNPCLADSNASKNTLRYAEMMRVIVPKAKPAVYDPNVPSSWDNAQLREWIEKNSGTPPISAAILAPKETGPQILRLPVPEFLSRCLKTEGVSPEQAQAFHSKLWSLHVDSQQQKRKPAASGTTTAVGAESFSKGKQPGPLSRLEMLDSSADPEPRASEIPFKGRIRPGMVVSWTPGPEYSIFGAAGSGSKTFAVILSPTEVVGERVRDVKGVLVNPPETGGKEKRWLCAMVTPAILPGAYDISIWRQAVVAEDQMTGEVVMEWDAATRYYYLTV